MVYIAPIVDGVLDDPVWENCEEGILRWNSTDNVPWEENSDFRGRFKAVWRGEQIYLSMVFTDDRLEIASRDLSRRDSIEIYIDENRNAHRRATNRYTIPFGENQPLDNLDRVYAMWSDDGTAFEASLSLDAPHVLGDAVGFDICYRDMDGDIQKEISWTDGDLDKPEKTILGDLTFGGLEEYVVRKTSTTWGKIKSLY
jgi:hypothetical protein